MYHPIPSVTFMIKTPILCQTSICLFFLYFWSSIWKSLKLVWKDYYFFFQLEHFCNSLKGIGGYAVAFKVRILLWDGI